MQYDSTANEVCFAQLLSFARYYAREVKLLHGIMRQRPGPAKLNLLAVRQLERWGHPRQLEPWGLSP